jgi:hypothetical protein
MTSEGETRFRATDVFAIVITDGELCIGALFVAVIDDADIAASENGSFVWIVSDGELCEVEVELLTHVQ